MLGGLGATELIIILLIALLLFGGKKIPEIAKGLGKGIKDFKGALSGQEDSKPEIAKEITKEKTPDNSEKTNKG